MRKTFGGAFLVVGTTIGAGMLSLPLITAACGLGMAIFLMVLSWSVMYITSLKLIKLCAEHPLGVNFTTLIENKMPPFFQVVFTVVYLLLLYALMAAYTTQGTDLINMLDGESIPHISINALIFIIIFGSIILSVTLSDYINRSFVSLKLIFFVLCLLSMVLYLNLSYAFFAPISVLALLFAWPTLLPSFGFQNIIPVLYEYQKGDVEQIKKSVLYGSLTVLGIYILWLMACLTILPQLGSHSYASIYANGNSLTDLIAAIKAYTHSNVIGTFLTVFINISIVTSFLCVGLSLLHYIRDIFVRFGINVNQAFAFLLTFIPPFIFTVFYPQGFILALQYAAIFAVIVFVFTPIFLDTSSRYKFKNLYPLILGSLVIVAQVYNLSGAISPF